MFGTTKIKNWDTQSPNINNIIKDGNAKYTNYWCQIFKFKHQFNQSSFITQKL